MMDMMHDLIKIKVVIGYPVTCGLVHVCILVLLVLVLVLVDRLNANGGQIWG